MDKQFETNREIEDFVRQDDSTSNEDRWHCVRQIRNDNCGVSDLLAPAEHYAYARLITSEQGKLGRYLLDVLAVGYRVVAHLPDWAKDALRTGNCAISPDTPESVNAAFMGSQQGLSDFENARLSRENAHLPLKERMDRGEGGKAIRTDDPRGRDEIDGRRRLV